MNKRDREKRDKNKKQSHHKNNFIIELGNKTGTVKRCLVNALDNLSAIRLAVIRYNREPAREDITRARVIRVFANGKKRIAIK